MISDVFRVGTYQKYTREFDKNKRSIAFKTASSNRKKKQTRLHCHQYHHTKVPSHGCALIAVDKNQRSIDLKTGSSNQKNKHGVHNIHTVRWMRTHSR